MALLFTVLGTVTPGSAVGWEGDHYTLTFYLALQLGFTRRQAFQIASATYALDWDHHTGPMDPSDPAIPRIWTNFHAFADQNLLGGCSWELQKVNESNQCGPTIMSVVHDAALLDPEVAGPCPDEVPKNVENSRSTQKEKLWELGKGQRNPGVLLHYSQDYYSHFQFDNFIGHAYASHTPDFLSASREKTICATSDTIKIIRQFREYLGTFSEEPGGALLPETAQEPDALRVDQILSELIKANEWVRGWNPRAYVVDGKIVDNAFTGVILNHQLRPGAPELKPSIAVIDAAIRKDVELGTLPKWEGKKFVADSMPDHWLQYAYNSKGEIIGAEGLPDPRAAVEKVELEFGTEDIAYKEYEGRPDWVKIHLRIPYKILGLANLSYGTDANYLPEGAGRPYLTPIPAIIRNQLSDDTTLYTYEFERDNGQFDDEVFDDIERKRSDVAAGKIIWTTSVQLYGYKPKEKKITLRLPVETCDDLTNSKWHSNLDREGQEPWTFKHGRQREPVELFWPADTEVSRGAAEHNEEDPYTLRGTYDGHHLDLTRHEIDYRAALSVRNKGTLVYSLDVGAGCNSISGTVTITSIDGKSSTEPFTLTREGGAGGSSAQGRR